MKYMYCVFEGSSLSKQSAVSLYMSILQVLVQQILQFALLSYGKVLCKIWLDKNCFVQFLYLYKYFPLGPDGRGLK